MFLDDILLIHVSSNQAHCTKIKRLNSLGRSLIIRFISSSKPTSRILSASSMIKHCRFLNKKSFVFCKWSNNRPGVATKMLIPKIKMNTKMENST